MIKIRVVIIDDNRLYAKCLMNTLATDEEITIAGLVKNGIEFIDSYDTLQPGIALLSAKMNKVETFLTIYVIRRLFPEIKIVVSVFLDSNQHYSSLAQSGVHGIINKNYSSDEVVLCIKKVNRNEKYISPIENKYNAGE